MKVFDLDRVLIDTDGFIAFINEHNLHEVPRGPELEKALDDAGCEWESFVLPGVREYLEVHKDECVIVTSAVSRTRGDNFNEEAEKAFQEIKIKRCGLDKLVSTYRVTGEHKNAELAEFVGERGVIIDDEREHIEVAKGLGYEHTVWFRTPKNLTNNIEGKPEFVESFQVSTFEQFVALEKSWNERTIMNVVNISLSPSILDPNGVTATRIRNYGRITEEYIVLVPYSEDKVVKLSDNVVVYGVDGANKLAKLWRIYSKVVSLAKEGRCDVISADQYYFGLMSVFVAWRFKVGFETIALGFEKFTWLRKKVAGFVFAHADSIRVNSPRLMDFVKKEFGMTGDKMHLVPIFVEVEKIGLEGERTDEEQSEYDQEVKSFKTNYSDNFNFLTVNRLVPVKNISLQLRAIAEIKKTHQEVFLHVLGDGPLEDSLDEEIKSLGLDNNVKLHGHTSGMKLGAFYAKADCFLLTSDSEGWGMVIIEALTAELPVIMTDVGAAGEVIIDGESGIVIPTGDLVALIKAMNAVIENDSLRSDLISGTKKALALLPSFDKILSLYKESWEYAYRKRK